VVQSLGAMAGAGILKGLSPASKKVEVPNIGVGIPGVVTLPTAAITNNLMCTPTPAPVISVGQTFGIELVITFILVLTVFATCDSNRTVIGGSGPLAIGLTVAMCHLWAVRRAYDTVY